MDPTAIRRPREPDLIPGYRLEKLVGHGGMGEVHRAVQLSLGRVVAVKLLASELARDPTFVARFEKEAAALAQLSHPNIVSIVDKGNTNGTYYLVMEFVDGPSLREAMRNPLLDTAQSLRSMLELCRAIDYAHSRGVVHRDLKPENILFDEQAGGLAKVTDFGLASFLDDKSARFNMTEAHVAMGTQSYMAPEQRVDAKTADHRADIYSLGVILYEALVGEVPVGTFDKPSARKPRLDPRLDAIVARCLRPLPQDRYAKVSELMADLEPLVPISFSEPPRRISRMERAKSRLRREVRRAVRVASVATVAAALGVLGLNTLRVRNRPPPRQLAGLSLAELTGAIPLTLPGDSRDGRVTRELRWGEGPQTLSMVVTGRTVQVDKGLLFPAPSDEHLAGRVTLDVVDVDGVALTFRAHVAAEQPPPTFLSGLKTALLETTVEPRAALMLTGAPGRYVAVVVGAHGEPMTLEWGLGERRGAMLGPASPPNGAADLALTIDENGSLRARWGKERFVGEPLELGPNWRNDFGQLPQPALGCVEGVCRMTGLALDLRRPPPPPAALPAPAPVAISSPSSPSPLPAARTLVAKAPVHHAASAVRTASLHKGTRATGPGRRR